MAQGLEEHGQMESTTLGVFRTASTVKGGRRFSFGALVVCGDKRGRVGYGHGKAKEVPTAIEKAEKFARRQMTTIPRVGGTIPHEVEGRYAASRVRLIPASPGTGVVAGGSVRAVLEMAGVSDCLTKCYGSTNKINTVKAVFDGLARLRMSEAVRELRGVDLPATEIEQKIERGKRFMPSNVAGERMRAPVNTIGQERRGGRGGGGGGRGRRGGQQGGGQQGGPADAQGGSDGARA